MKKLSFLLALIVLTFSNSFAKKRDKRTPFDKVIYENQDAYIEHNGEWHKLISIENKPIEEYLNMAIEMEPTNWKKGFHRYLHYIMDEMQMKRGESVKVCFEEDGKISCRDFKLKKENRDLATEYHDKVIGKNRINRTHQTEIPELYKYLNVRTNTYKKTDEDWLSKEDAIHDLEHLEWQIDNNYSYSELRGFNYKLAIDAMIADLNLGIHKRDFALQLKLFMANFGDGHSSVSMSRNILTKEERRSKLPFVIIKHEGKYLAVNPETKSYYKENYPELTSINGVEINDLAKLARKLVAKTSSKFVERNITDYLHLSYFLTQILGKESHKQVEVGFRNDSKEIKETLNYDEYRYKALKRRYDFKQEILNNNIGYLAFNEHMYSANEFIDSLNLVMKNFKSTDGLIIDIRGNGGGSRAPLRAILPYLIKNPVVCNVARYRVNKAKDIHPDNGYFEKRYAYPENYSGYTKQEKEVIKDFKTNFTPSRLVSDEKFTDYNYMIVSPSTDDVGYYYDKPVIVLVDEGCFSASDIFAAGIKQGDRVKLLGNTTGGGSGFTASRRLPNSGIKVRMSRMFSYQPDGSMYDGQGVTPDFKFDYTLDDKMGKTDSQLEKAIELIQDL